MAESDAVKHGRQCLLEGRYEDALSIFEQALLLDENNPDVWNCKGAALRSMGRYNEANECFDRALKIDPRDRNSS